METGGTKLLCAIGTGPDDVRAELRIPTGPPANTLARAVAFFREQRAPVRAVGIASFGPVDLDPTSPTWGFITTTPKPGWTHTDVAGPFRAALGVPIAFDTDVNGAALAEYRWGAGRGFDPLVYLTDCDPASIASGQFIQAEIVGSRAYDLVARPASA